MNICVLEISIIGTFHGKYKNRLTAAARDRGGSGEGVAGWSEEGGTERGGYLMITPNVSRNVETWRSVLTFQMEAEAARNILIRTAYCLQTLKEPAQPI